ncbi:MAG: hypothetical protein OEY00_12905, partial [Gammaproteobacteria bacterium]|nr:hypothetical protein [Gammaproteobacteria bacterium]
SEESVISGLLQGLADIVEENAQAAWGVSHKLQANNFDGSEISISAAKAAQIDEETLKQRLLDAMVHSGWNGNAGGGKNPQHQGVQDFNWPKFAAEHSAMGISEVVNSALTQQTKSFSTSINKDLTSSVTANNKRSELLWWKASLYSRLLNVSYRSLNPLNAAVCMSFDLAEEIDSIYPESVDYLLRETLKDVHGEQVEEERLLSDWLNDSSNLHENIKAALNKHVSSRDQRKPLLNSWATVVQSSENTDFFTETGIDKNAKLSASDLAVWLFHGLQAQKLVTNK